MEKDQIMNRYSKLKIALIHYLAGRNYFKSLKALAFAEKHHQGFRKDGKTPEFQHLIEVALHATTLRDLINEEETITSALLHDVREDYGVSHDEITDLFGPSVSDAVERLSKITNEVKKTPNFYFAELTASPIASIVKGCDRAHNFQSMPKVFSKEKQLNYLKEGEELFMPMLKEAAKKFPEQWLAYQNIRHHLKAQMALIHHSIEASENGRV